ncbi:MAG: polysaccharide deacetylase [Lysobacteraceae bacterium]|nr:MAG: polysaccharide deacetylase [Xanthomonadaceae bacterium]
METNSPAPPNREVAITFDDIPGSATLFDRCDASAVRAFNTRMLRTIRRERIAVTGFVVGGSLCGALRDALLPSLLRDWREAGHRLGNHGFSHWDYNRVGSNAYLADILHAERVMGDALPDRDSGQRYFRAPLLHTGDTAEKRSRLMDFLRERGYRNGLVTIDNQEWVFATAYARAKRERDAARMRRVVDAYLAHLDAAFAYFETEARVTFGREPPQILLLHANELNADHFDRVMAMIRQRGYRVVDLDHALADPVYAEDDAYIGPRGLSWTLRHALKQGRTPGEEPREPAWLRTP